MKSYMVLRKAFKKVGSKAVAAELKLSPSLVYQWSRGRAGQSAAANPLDRVAQLVALTGDAGLLDWLCAQAGGLFVRPGQLPAQLKEYEQLLFTEIENTFKPLITPPPALPQGGPQCPFRRRGRRCNFPQPARN